MKTGKRLGCVSIAAKDLPDQGRSLVVNARQIRA